MILRMLYIILRLRMMSTKSTAVMRLVPVRTLSSMAKEPKKLETKTSTFELSDRHQLHVAKSRESWQWKTDPTKVLVLFFPWLGSKEKHVQKYRDLYLSRGLDVLTVKSVVSDFLWPPKAQKFGKQTMEVLAEHCNNYEHFLLHTMSVGAYNMTVLRMLAAGENDPSGILRRCRGLIYDSIVGGSGKGGVVQGSDAAEVDKKPVHATNRMLHGIAVSASKNRVVQLTIKGVGKMYLFFTKKNTVAFYDKSLTVVRDEPLPVPTLMYASRNDPMVDAYVVEQLAHIWRTSKGVPVEVKLWDVSGHAQHLVKHTEEYVETLDKFLSDIFSESLPSLPGASKL
ncbi:uncharacterized protein LOC101850135 [Aplysia californica]|uniref:Uncharacterized protein LOC101850135 n=1 Tax=Aplysia californica TaxID=6500 RepID=A0ABM0JE63_APLCA|nr:uncharacterized protein LOC101850135 [Aplysia californica]